MTSRTTLDDDVYVQCTLIGRWGIARNAVDKVIEVAQPDSTQPANCRERSHTDTDIQSYNNYRHAVYSNII